MASKLIHSLETSLGRVQKQFHYYIYYSMTQHALCPLFHETVFSKVVKDT